METKELKEWFWNKFNSCYYVVHEDFPQSLFMFYDEMFIRKMKLCKLCKLSGKEVVFPKKPLGICLFEQDYKNKHLYMSYSEISHFLYKNYSSKCVDWVEIRKLVDSWLKETEKVNVLTSHSYYSDLANILKETEKVNILTFFP